MAEVPEMLSKPLPRGVLIGAALLVGFSLMLAGGMRLSGINIAQPTGTAVTVRHLNFADRSDGAVIVTDAAAGNRVVDIVKPETGYFLRATMRTLARQRHREDIGAETPFTLTGWNDGRLTLDDPTTDRRVDLEAFGETNEEVFAKLLMTPPTMATASASATVQTATP
jgi:putative photosynthetic complex assembly protein